VHPEMEGRDRLEDRIAYSLAHMSPENMQRVAEDNARIRFPNRFPHFHFRALSAEGKSRRGWPDAWITIDGRVDGVEATSAGPFSGTDGTSPNECCVHTSADSGQSVSSLDA
jgi:hypothetical protein